jgi:hypothetical protein
MYDLFMMQIRHIKQGDLYIFLAYNFEYYSAARHYLDGGSYAPVGIQHPYRSPPRGRFDYGTPDYRTHIDLDH